MTTVLPLVLSKLKQKNSLNLPEAAAGAGILLTISDVVSLSYASVCIINKNKKCEIESQSLNSYMDILNEF